MNIIATILSSAALLISGWFGVHNAQNNPPSVIVGANQAISALTSYTTPLAADLFPIVDTAAGQTKQVSYSNLKSTIQTAFNSVYSPIAGGTGIVTVGTIAAGTWNGTAIGVGYGGTGTTSPAQYRVLFGNAGSGITIATSTGTSGQFLTSCGANCFPQWQTAAIDQAANYTWTGLHIFTASTTFTATTTFTGSVAGIQKFGGTGSDGALAISSGTTTINLGGLPVVTKNYTSISITSTGGLAFSNPAAGGTKIVLKSQGDVTLTCTGVCIDASGMGSANGTSASAGTNPNEKIDDGSTRGGAGATSAATPTNGGATFLLKNMYLATSSVLQIKSVHLVIGSGGGGGGAADSSNGGIGGIGGGALYIESGGYFNFTRTIWAKGNSGLVGGNGAGSSAAGGGGGGAGGSVVILYNRLVANTGTISAAGGAGGNGGNSGGSGTPGQGGGGGGSYQGAGGAGGGANADGSVGAGTNGGAAGLAGTGGGSGDGGGGGGGAEGFSYVDLNSVFF